jgi:hypothetical protein
MKASAIQSAEMEEQEDSELLLTINGRSRLTANKDFKSLNATRRRSAQSEVNFGEAWIKPVDGIFS